MSGKQYTEVQLQRERQEKLNLLQNLQGLVAESMALQEKLAAMVSGMSEGLRSTFNTEVEAVRQWLRDTPAVEEYGMDHPLDGLKRAQHRQQQITDGGRSCLKHLQLALTQKADALGRAVAEQRATVTQSLLQHGHLLRLWYGDQAVSDWGARLNRAERLFDTDHYQEAQDQLTALHSELQAKAAQAASWETQHQRRLYLLKALRQVSADLGFAETTPPTFEKPGERGSRIVLTVDTHDRGRIEFFLTLEGLGSFSEMGDTQCPVEFGTLSEQLQEQFGIQTQFRPAAGESNPALRRKNEKELPDDGAQQAHA